MPAIAVQIPPRPQRQRRRQPVLGGQTEDQTGLVLGLATQYRLTPALSLGAGWDLYRYGGQANLGFWHLGLDWRVGAGL